MKPTILVAALSGRAIAQSLLRSGYVPVVADCFGDEDLFAAAENWSRLKVDDSFHVDMAAALQTLSTLSASANTKALVLGSGFEFDKNLLAALSERFDLMGNSVETITKSKDPHVFFPLLDALGIRHPAVSYAKPENVEGWLAKPVGRCGGLGISPASANRDNSAGIYFQQRMEGTPMSVLFIANGAEADIIGINRLLLSPAESKPYLYGGVLGACAVKEQLIDCLSNDVIAVSGALGLRGLNGVDFILSEGSPYWLEINPRPPASFELYETLDRSLIDWHIRASQGELPPRLSLAGTSVNGVRVAYATTPLRAPPCDFWPSWCRDLPIEGQSVVAGAPICTISASGDNDAITETLLMERMQALLYLLDGFRIAA